jgi:hypothetical protein
MDAQGRGKDASHFILSLASFTIAQPASLHFWQHVRLEVPEARPQRECAARQLALLSCFLLWEIHIWKTTRTKLKHPD